MGYYVRRKISLRDIIFIVYYSSYIHTEFNSAIPYSKLKLFRTEFNSFNSAIPY